MMASLAGMERSHKQWLSLLDEAGLRMKDVLAYTDEAVENLIIAVKI